MRHALALIALALPIHAQADYPFHPAVHASAAVNTHGARRAGEADDRMYLFKSTGRGVTVKEWSGRDATGSWSAERSFTQNEMDGSTPLGTSIAAYAGEVFHDDFEVFLPRFGAAVNFETAASALRVGFPTVNWFLNARFWQSLASPSTGWGDDLQPMARFSWASGGALRVNVFGNAVEPCRYHPSTQACDMPLREAWFDGAQWRFTDHGVPPGNTQVHLGPHSAVWDHRNARGYVFAVGDDDQLWLRGWNTGCGGWCWQPLEAPDRTRDLRTPVAMTYWGGRVQVFVPGRTDDGFHLYGRHFDGRDWHDWQDYGKPNNLQESSYGGHAGFDLTGAAVWYTANGTLRINVFGTLDAVNRPAYSAAPHDGGQITEFLWDGARWTWGNPRLFPVLSDRENSRRDPMPRRFQTMDVAVVEGRGWERISVFGEDEIGGTWEYFWDGAGWHWSPR